MNWAACMTLTLMLMTSRLLVSVQARPPQQKLRPSVEEMFEPEAEIEAYMKSRDPQERYRLPNGLLKGANSDAYDVMQQLQRSHKLPATFNADPDFTFDTSPSRHAPDPKFHPFVGASPPGEPLQNSQEVSGKIAKPDLRSSDIVSVYVHPQEEEEEEEFEEAEPNHEIQDGRDQPESKGQENDAIKEAEHDAMKEEGHDDHDIMEEEPAPVAHAQTNVKMDYGMDPKWAVGKKEPLTSTADVYLLAVVAGCAIAGISGLALAGICWYRLHKKVKDTSNVDYPAYGVTGPVKEKTGSPGDRKLAQSAQMYHYQHQKQQMIASERLGTNGNHPGGRAAGGGESDAESEEECEEGDYTVFECPGLATTGEMEVRNPMFNEQTPVATPAEK